MTSNKISGAVGLVRTVFHSFRPALRLIALFAFLAVWASGEAFAFVAIPPNEDEDIRFYAADGTTLEGEAALRKMPDAGLNVWVAGNQYFTMTEVIAAFQAGHPTVSVGLLTLPPGLLAMAVEEGGWRYRGFEFPLTPDIYGTVSIAQLEGTGRIGDYTIYMHNALELMVARGNPKHVSGLGDLVRPDLRVMLPNPLTEGIMTFYGKPILERSGLWKRLSPAADCADCTPVPNVHFTAVHHREIPAHFAASDIDVGLVWRTEEIEAERRGDAVDGIDLPAGQNAADASIYVAGLLAGTAHARAASAFLDFMVSPQGQDIYARFGFLPATAEERRVRPLLP